MARLATVKIELDVEGLPAPSFPGDALGRAGVPAEDVAAEVKAEQRVKVEEIKTEVLQSEIKSPRGEWLAKRAPVPPEGVAAAPAAKRRRSGGAAPSGGAFCRRSRPRVPLPPSSHFARPRRMARWRGWRS